MACELTYRYLSECFELNEATGVLTWKQRDANEFATEHAWKIWCSRFVGKSAGGIKRRHRDQKCYLTVRLQGVGYLVHRIVYAMHHRISMKDVPGVLDHIDGDATNNRPNNLRAADARRNSYNRLVQLNNTSGQKGVAFNGCHWRARITMPDGVCICLGTFNTKEEAAAAYMGAAKVLHGEFYRDTQAAA